LRATALAYFILLENNDKKFSIIRKPWVGSNPRGIIPVCKPVVVPYTKPIFYTAGKIFKPHFVHSKRIKEDKIDV